MVIRNDLCGELADAVRALPIRLIEPSCPTSCVFSAGAFQLRPADFVTALRRAVSNATKASVAK
jgi:hypothetical protein